MTGDTGNRKPTADGGRQARLRAALRENLRRRKAQARSRGEKAGEDGPPREPEAGSRR